MPENIVIPSWVWWFIIKSVSAILFGIGAIVVLIFWKTGRLPFSQSIPKQDKHDPERRRHDELIERLIDQNQAQNERFMVAYQENAGALNGAINALRALAQEISALAVGQKTLSSDLKTDINRIHERVDFLAKK